MTLPYLKLAVSICVAVAGAGGAAYFTGVIDKPDAGLQDRGDWVPEEELKVESEAYVHNPNPLGLNISTLDADYLLKMNGVKLAEGSKKGVSVPKNGNKTLEFISRFETENIPEWWVSHLENSEKSRLRIPIKASMTLGPLPLSGGYSYKDSISTDIESTLSESISKLEGDYSRTLGPDAGLEANDFKITVVDASSRFGDVSRETTELVIPLKIKNRNSYAVPTPKMEGSLEMNGIKVAEFDANNVETASDTSIPPGESREITVKAGMSNQNIDEWFASHARKTEKTDAVLNIKFGFNVGDAELMIPSGEGMNCTFDFATEILVDEKAETEGFQGCSGFVRNSGGGEDGSGGLLDDGNNSSGDNSTNDTDGGLPDGL
jgi:LEA14-like dessication related protein